MSHRRWPARVVLACAVLAAGGHVPAALADPSATPPVTTTPASTATPALAAPSQSGGPVPTTQLSPVQLGGANARPRLIGLSWAAVPDAARYSARLAKAAGGPPVREVTTARPATVFTGLSAHTRYWVSVQALDAAGRPIGAPSAEQSVTTPYPLAAPAVSARATSSRSVRLAWRRPAGKLRLLLEWSAPGDKPERTLVRGTGKTRTLLTGGTRYTVRVRLVDRTPQSEWSEPVGVTTPKGDPLRVGSYNVQCANCRAWKPRRAAIADAISDRRLDVVAIQEASADEITGTSLAQFEDLERLLAPSGYRLTNRARFNCRNARSADDCRRQYRGASGSTRILYNARTLRLIRQGSRLLQDRPGWGSDRFVAWAVLEHRINGKRFLFTSKHLESRNDTGGSRTFYDLRRGQLREVLDVIARRRDGLPVIAAGDYNSTKWDMPSNAPYDMMRAAGFVDPLGNSYRSRTTAEGATVEKRINTEYSSYNNSLPVARRSRGLNGSNPDYIFVSPMRVAEWETVVSVDSAGRFTSRPPSDHNLIRATVYLP